MSNLRRFVVAFAVAFALASAGTASAYHTNWIAQNCNWAAPTPTSYITRDGSITVALYARNEGYQWGGGCWNDNDVDDSPGDPKSDPQHRRRGPRLLRIHVQGLAGGDGHEQHCVPSVGEAATHPRAVLGRALHESRGRSQLPPVQIGRDQNGRLCKAKPISE